jgi:Flp pilus assembly protein TadG
MTTTPAAKVSQDQRDKPAACRCNGDAGAATTELVIAMPLMLLLVLASVHIGLWFHARQIVTSAAQEGARAARASDGTDADGYDRVNQMLAELGRGSVNDTNTEIGRSADIVTVTVTGHSPAVVPGLVLSVSASSSSPIEEFKP